MTKPPKHVFVKRPQYSCSWRSPVTELPSYPGEDSSPLQASGGPIRTPGSPTDFDLAFHTIQFKKGITNVIPTLSSMPEQYTCTNRSLLVLYELRICNHLPSTSRHEGIRKNQKPSTRPPRPPDTLMLYRTKMHYSTR